MRFLSYAAVSSDSILDEFVPHPYPTQKRGKMDKPKPAPATVAALKELDACGSIAAMKETKGYLSAADYRVFARCQWRRSNATDRGTP
jgi:hypothetical protein